MKNVNSVYFFYFFKSLVSITIDTSSSFLVKLKNISLFLYPLKKKDSISLSKRLSIKVKRTQSQRTLFQLGSE
jgi:hypothetical protein